MIIPERKRAVAAILSGKKDEAQKLAFGGKASLDKVGESPDPDMSPEREEMHAHMQEFMGAFKNNDHVAAVDHMMNFLNAHQAHQEKEGESESKGMDPSDK